MAKMATFTDAFPGTSLNSSNWYVEPDSSNGQPSGTATVSSGTLSLSGGTYSDTGFYTSVNSQNAYDLTGSYAFVKVTPGESGTGDGDTGIGMYASNFSDGYNFDVTGGSLLVEKTVSDNPTTVHSVTYNATSMAWLRVREASGTLYFETSPDSSVWSTQYATTTETVGSWSAASSYVQLFYGSNSGSSKPTGTAGFQDFNVASGGGGGGGTSGLVQETSGSTTGTSLTLTFPAPVAAGHTVVLAIAGFYDGTVTAITIGGTGGTFTHLAGSGGTGGNNVGIYANNNVAASSATVVITTSAAGILAWAYDVEGAVTYDTSGGAVGTGTSWSSGASGETIPYPHFVVGAAVIVANTGTITPGGSGWTNETSYRNVSGAAGHAIGGVSGYQQPSSGGATYTYSGTSSASSAWGAVTATFLVVAQAGWAWGGTQFNEHAAAGYTGITATFTLPSSVPLNSGALCSVWVGLGNVYQCGVYLGTNTARTGNVDTSPWSWWLPGAGELWNTAAYPTGAGDSLTLAMSLDSAYWYATITNNTQSWTYTEVKSVLQLNLNSWATSGTPALETSPVWVYPVPYAEVVIEQELPLQLPEYGTITFTDIATVPAVSAAPLPLFPVVSLADGMNEYPTVYNAATGSFAMVWNKAS